MFKNEVQIFMCGTKKAKKSNHLLSTGKLMNLCHYSGRKVFSLMSTVHCESLVVSGNINIQV